MKHRQTDRQNQGHILLNRGSSIEERDVLVAIILFKLKSAETCKVFNTLNYIVLRIRIADEKT